MRRFLWITAHRTALFAAVFLIATTQRGCQLP
jgi:hypothetical protein